MNIREKITQGKWEAYPDDNGFHYVTSEEAPRPYIVATTTGALVNESNALAISKVPEMLELIEQFVQWGTAHKNDPVYTTFVKAKQLWEELNKEQ